MYKKFLAYPHLVWMLIFVLVPMVLVLLYSINVLPAGVEEGFSI